jgi:hypothetical protein
MRPLVVVSPHLDDAILSVGATIAGRVAAGQHVTIATVCSVVDDERRRAHDRAAAAIVGATTIHLGIDDAPRRGFRLSWAGLCEVDDDDGIVDDMARCLAPVLAGDTEVWGPLGCGGHVDHRATLSALLGLQPDLTLYEERPYARQLGRVAAAWSRLGAVVDDADHADHAGGDGADGYDEYDPVVPFLTRVGAGPVAPIAAPWSLSFAGCPWKRVACPVGPSGRQLRLRALQAYESEWRMLAGPHDLGWPLADAAEFLWRSHRSIRTSVEPS